MPVPAPKLRIVPEGLRQRSTLEVDRYLRSLSQPGQAGLFAGSALTWLIYIG